MAEKRKTEKGRVVAEWQRNNPSGKKIDCIRETGFCRRTVDRHWDEELFGKNKILQAWRHDHPEGTKAACIRETGLSKPTVYKYWNN